MARRFYSDDDLQAVKQSLDALEMELQPATHVRRDGSRRFVCPKCRRDGKVKVYVGKIDGSAVWSCVACGAAGNIMSLYMDRGMDRGQAVIAVMDRWADVVAARTGDSSQKGSRRPGSSTSTISILGDKPAAAASTMDDERRRQASRRYCISAAARLWDASGKSARDYLHGRGFSDETLKRFRLGYDPQCRAGGSLKYGRAAVVVPYSRKLEYYVVRFLRPIVDRTTGKEIKCLNMPGREPVFNARALWAYDAVIVVEGWADALSIAQAASRITSARVGAISINGASNQRQLVDLLTDNQTSSRLLIALDADASGQDGALLLSRRLDEIGQDHELISGSAVWAVWDGCKDANDVLAKYGEDSLAGSLEVMLNDTAVRM